jgi:TRAP-type uncharacterized transport system fused permease subunit
MASQVPGTAGAEKPAVLHATETHAPAFAGALFWVAIVFSTFQIITAAFSPLSSSVVRAVHVGFLLVLVFVLHPPLRQRALGWASAPWHLPRPVPLGVRGRPGPACRRDDPAPTWWWASSPSCWCSRPRGASWVMRLPLICLFFLLYGLFGQYLPGGLAHRGYGLDQIVSQLGFGTEGIYGTPTYVSSSYIFLFILFGAFLEQAGMITLFTDFALGLFGHTKGGPAKVAVVSSG